ncbi:MAG TPA: OmpA family protein [Gemmatimonadaceae bacterium]|nr:OmpA family protein [Gemmatimonadaceae bacterium]
MQTLTRLTVAAALAGAMASSTPAAASAQGIFGRMKDRAAEAAKRKVEERTEKRAGEATDAALDKAECKVPGTTCDDSEKSEGNAAAASADKGKSAKLKPGQGAWKNYDFVPGDRVIFAEDFSDADVGDFPKRLTFKSGNIEVVEWSGARYLSTNTFGSRFSLPLPETLPERFTLELDYSAAGGNGMTIYFTDPDKGSDRTYVDMGTWSGGLRNGGIDAMGSPANQYGYKDAVFPVRIMADGKHVKVYMGETRVANVPNATLGRATRIWFVLPGREERAAMIGNIRVAAGGKKLYDALSANGRVATQGILFDVGSDRIRPESTPTLKEITAMLKEHAGLKLSIEGHTDNVGDDDANEALSEQRAAAVKAYLVSQGIADGRLTSKGLGASKPVASNDRPEGRQQNRRVELVKR